MSIATRPHCGRIVAAFTGIVADIGIASRRHSAGCGWLLSSPAVATWIPAMLDLARGDREYSAAAEPGVTDAR